MQVDVRKSDGVTILVLKGKIDTDVGHVELRNAVHDALQNSALKILLHMGGVTRIESGGIDALVNAYEPAAKRGARLRFCNLPRTIMDLVRLTPLITIYDFYNTEEEALEAFRAV